MPLRCCDRSRYDRRSLVVRRASATAPPDAGVDRQAFHDNDSACPWLPPVAKQQWPQSDRSVSTVSKVTKWR